jgi:hypothetical protein
MFIKSIEDPVSVDEHGFTAIHFELFLAELKNRSPQCIITRDIITFMNTLGKNKSGGNNAVSRLQFFLNAYIQEISLERLNTDTLVFIGDDHYSLIRGGTGTDDPDFYFYASNNARYTIDVKIYYSEESYYKNLQTTNFHKADYCLVYLIKDKAWKFSRKLDSYSILEQASTYYKTDPCLNEIILPKNLNLVKFFTDTLSGHAFSKLIDSDVPNTVNYDFYI